MGTTVVKNYLLLMLSVMLCSLPAVSKDKGDGVIEVIDINALPTKYSELFQDVKAKSLKGENAFVPCFIQLQFATRATFKARYGGKTDPKVQVTVIMKGVADAVMQEIADSAGAFYREALVTAGYEVVPISALDDNSSYQKIKEKSDPRGVEEKLAFAPRYTTHAKTFTYNDGPIYSTKAALSMYGMMTKLKKGAIIHKFTINFANFSTDKAYSSAWGETTKSIEIAAMPQISIGANSQWFNAKSNIGGLNNLAEWGLKRDFIVSTEQVDNNTYVMNVDPAVFKDCCLQIIKKNIELNVAYFRQLSKKD